MLGVGFDRWVRLIWSVAFERGLQELARCGGVADCGLFIDAEDGGQVQWVGAVGQGFFELAVDAETFQGRGQTAQGVGDPDFADRAGLQRALLASR